MGESKKDDSGKRGKRQRSSNCIDKSSSDTELARERHRSRISKLTEKWPFLECLTVDSLARFRRRRIEDHPKDTLSLHKGDEQEDMKDLLTEYRYAFRASSDDVYRVGKENIWPSRSKRLEEASLYSPSKLDVTQVPDVEDDNAKSEVAVECSPIKSVSSLALALDTEQKDMDSIKDCRKLSAPTNLPEQPFLTRRNTNLTCDGDFYASTENSLYVAHEGCHRAELARRPTSLRMEGEMETTTEKCEKFIRWLNVTRPEISRVPTHLKLEGEFETSTENHDQYIPFVGARRPEILRQGAHLKLEGESRFIPEYADVFKALDLKEGRQKLKKPETHLKLGGNFYDATNIIENFMSPRTREKHLMDQLAKDVEAEEESNRKDADKKEEEEKRKKREKDMKLLVSKLEDLKGPPPEIPEYKDAYKDFPRERPKIKRPEDELGRADGSKVVSSPTHTRFPLKIDQDPEYKSIYLDLSKDRSLYKKPPPIPRTVQPYSEHISYAASIQERYEPKSEMCLQHVSYGRMPRSEMQRTSMNFQPTYTHTHSNQRIDETRRRRSRERSLSSSRKKDNYWINNDNGEQFGRVNAADEQDAFQLLNTKVHEESVVGKPPPGSRRLSRARRPTHLEFADRSTLQNRSPSPSYRLHVCNVDDEPRGFGQRKRSPSFHQSSDRSRDFFPEPLFLDDTNRPYSPSFAKEKRQQPTSGQSFVVLDDGRSKVNTNVGRRRQAEDVDRHDRNAEFLSNERTGSLRGKHRNRTPPKWMPPWYDSTDTI